MNLVKLQQQIRKQTKTFGKNLVLDGAEKTKEYKKFMNALKSAIKQQFEDIVDEKLIKELTVLQKAEISQNALLYLATKWISVSNYLKEGVMQNFFKWAGTIGGQAALDAMQITVAPFKLDDDDVDQYFNAREQLLIQSIDDTNKKRLLEVLKQGQQEMLTDEELTKLIRSKIPEISATRADLIARNELANAVSTLQFETFRRNNVESTRWVTVLDDRTCPFCEPLHNKVLKINQHFISSVTNEKSLKTTTYDVIRPPLHVNCRCYLEEVIEGFEVRNNQIVWTGN